MFNWGKMLTNKERETLHANRRQINKGKGKRMPSSPLRGISGSGGETATEDEPSIFHLHQVNLIIKKVRRSK